jgi:hypothetical protein
VKTAAGAAGQLVILSKSEMRQLGDPLLRAVTAEFDVPISAALETNP